MSAKNTPKSPTTEESCPEQWREVTLGSVAEIRFSAVNKIPEPGEVPVRLCNYIDVYNNDYITADMEFMHATATQTEIERFALQVGDVIITKDSETPDDIGVPAVVDSTASDLVCGYHLALIRPKTEEVDSTFLAKQLGHHRIARYFGRQANGSTRYGLSTTSIANTLLRLPLLPEQQKAVSQILRLVDEAIGKTEQVIAKLKQVRAGLLHDLLTRGLDDHGQLRDPLAHPEQFQDSPLGRIPKVWHCSRLDAVLDGIDAGKSPDYPDQPAPPGEWGVLKVSAIWPDGFRPHENKHVTKPVDKIAAYAVNDGDLLISRSNTYELVGIVTLVENAPPRLMLCDKSLRLTLKPDRGINAFFAYLLQTRTARNQIEINATGTSGSMKNISQDVIRSMRLAYPDVTEQKQILAAAAPINDQLKALDRELVKLMSLKSGLMTDLLTGRVPVPADLLENITSNDNAAV